MIVSDADEREVGLEDPKAVRPEDALKYVATKLPKMNGVTALSVIIKPGDAACLARHQNIFDLGVGGRYGTVLADFAKKAGGLTASVCDKDFGPALAKLSETVRQQIESIELKDVPLAGTLKVSFSPAFNGTWTLSGKKIMFSKPVPKGTRVDVRYLTKISK